MKTYFIIGLILTIALMALVFYAGGDAGIFLVPAVFIIGAIIMMKRVEDLERRLKLRGFLWGSISSLALAILLLVVILAKIQC